MDGEDVSEAVRGDDVTKNVSDYCKPAVVRAAMVEQQRAIGAGAHAVCEGRDIGTVVFPNARLKFFMIASAEERARRRRKDFEKLGVSKSIEELVREINERDRKDSTRELAPLIKAADAEELDTTDLDFERQVAHIVNKARPLLKK
jgi:cytidylate kinase